MQSDRDLKAETMPMTFWMTRLPGSGKSNLATAMKTALQERGLNCDILVGDVIR
ncbi:MAG: adenylyl-sulfate kinase [Rhodocyclaceae bacterium]|nr:adenylyl-sulfate kinase [Rhodocyclaceae bacterium]